MQLVIKWLSIALPFLSLGQTAILLLNKPALAAELGALIDGLKRFMNNAKAELGSAPRAAEGLAEINIFGGNVLKLLAALKTAGLSRDDTLLQANRLVDSLYDKAQVTQAKHGKDAAALANFKIDAAAIRTAIVNG